jgi:hypothetical protein
MLDCYTRQRTLLVSRRANLLGLKQMAEVLKLIARLTDHVKLGAGSLSLRQVDRQSTTTLKAQALTLPSYIVILSNLVSFLFTLPVRLSSFCLVFILRSSAFSSPVFAD